MEKKKINELSDAELDNVNGGASIMAVGAVCPKCGSENVNVKTVNENSGTTTYYVCKDCDFTWK